MNTNYYLFLIKMYASTYLVIAHDFDFLRIGVTQTKKNPNSRL